MSNPIKFSKDFTEKLHNYIKEEKDKATVLGFGLLIGTDVITLNAWANKRRKDEKGNITEDLARPKFNAALKELQKIQDTDKTLNAKQEFFCELYASDKEFFGNGVEAYMEAYDLHSGDPKDYNTARTNASRLLTNANILKRIDELLHLGPLNTSFVDKQLAFVITQNADLGSKVSAIREYNKLEQRITEKIDHTTKGDKLPTPIYGGRSTEL